MQSISKLVLAIAAALLVSCGNTDPQSQGSSPEIDAPLTVQNDGVLIDFQDHGEGDLTLLFVHGWCINQTYWSHQVEALSSDYRIVTMDLPGFGASGTHRENWSMEAYGADVNAVIDQLNLTDVILIGHSMGGDVILESALHQDKVIALIGVDNFKDVGVEYSDEMKAELDGFVGLLKQNFSEVAPAYAEGALFHPSTDSLIKAHVMNDFRQSDSVIATSSLEALFEYASKEAQQLAQLKQPLYLINSDASPTLTDGLDATGVAYEVIDIPATGHYPMIEKPEVFNRLLLQTIQTIEAAHHTESTR
ncbi:alpha/beta hydrolase [Pontibacter sp. G13]|uniref:alpha/beta fold hydrolase n=1 Tax=Pontibacter sp. G13 TaxID=3074898 RepID=UPI00288AF818|nr:alpha/beta hydrolase [Pontibacter sp. G13]WNJ20352.1 alpha/beta hydrolase [Pontibacter sp. G13]